MSSAPTLAEQAAEAERHAVNHAGHVANLRDLVRRGKRPVEELEMQAARLPAAQALARTIRDLADKSTP